MTRSEGSSWTRKRAVLADWLGVSQARADAHAAAAQAVPGGHWVRGPRTLLTTSQHILLLLLTVFTGGLWGIVWIIRGVQGNKAWLWVPDA
jgi:hypothetical protein